MKLQMQQEKVDSYYNYHIHIRLYEKTFGGSIVSALVDLLNIWILKLIKKKRSIDRVTLACD